MILCFKGDFLFSSLRRTPCQEGPASLETGLWHESLNALRVLPLLLGCRLELE